MEKSTTNGIPSSDDAREAGVMGRKIGNAIIALEILDPRRLPSSVIGNPDQ